MNNKKREGRYTKTYDLEGMMKLIESYIDVTLDAKEIEMLNDIKHLLEVRLNARIKNTRYYQNIITRKK